jgi:hypothetical protein
MVCPPNILAMGIEWEGDITKTIGDIEEYS